MSVNYTTTVLTNRLQQVINAIDAGPSNGFMRLFDNTNNLLSSLQLARPCASIAGAVLTFNGLALLDPAATASGTAVTARVEDSAGTIIVSGLTVGGSGDATDILFAPNAIIVAGQTVAITQATITGN